MFNNIENSYDSFGNQNSWFGIGGNRSGNQNLDDWFDQRLSGMTPGMSQAQWPGQSIGPVQSGCQGQGTCSSQTIWPGQGTCSSQTVWPGQGIGPVQPNWPGQGNCGNQQEWPWPGPGPVQPGCQSNKICVSPDELAHIIEDILESTGSKKCCKGVKNMRCANNGCLGYAPQNNGCQCGYGGYNYGYNNYNYGNCGCGYDDGLWWIIIIFFFGGFCFF